MSQGDVGCVSMLECTVNCEGGEVACSRRCLFRGPSGCVGFWHCWFSVLQTFDSLTVSIVPSISYQGYSFTIYMHDVLFCIFAYYSLIKMHRHKTELCFVSACIIKSKEEIVSHWEVQMAARWLLIGCIVLCWVQFKMTDFNINPYVLSVLYCLCYCTVYPYSAAKTERPC